MDNSDALMTCNDCFLYAGGGLGFEFETSSLSLVYMKIWLEAEFSMSINIDIQAKGRVQATNSNSTNSSDDLPTRNYWAQEGRRNVDITKITPDQFSKTKQCLAKDIVFVVSRV